MAEEIMTNNGAGDIYNPAKDLDGYEYKREPHFVMRVLWHCAGADKQLLMRCPESDRVKVEGIGGIVLGTAVLAAFSMWFAMYTVFGPKAAIDPPTDYVAAGKALIAALVWGLVIYNIDRTIVSSTGHEEGWKKYFKAFPRILMAVLIGISISKPLEIKILDSELDAAILTVADEKYNELIKIAETDYKRTEEATERQINELNAKLSAGEQRLSELNKLTDEKQSAYDAEIAGSSGSRKRGDGPASRAAFESYQRKLAERNEYKKTWDAEKKNLETDIVVKRSEIAKAKELRDQENLKSRAKANSVDGLGKRIQLAHELFPMISTMLMILFIVIEITPVLIKLMLEVGPYEVLKKNQEMIVKARHAIGATPSSVVDPDGTYRTLMPEDKFSVAETILDYQSDKLKTERNLSRLAHEVFEDKVGQEIKTSPEKFISKS